MMQDIESNNRTVISVVAVFFILVAFMLVCPKNIGEIYWKNYAVDYLSFAVMLIIFLVVWSRNGYDIFEPYFFVSVIYIILFTVTPMIDLILGEVEWFGVDLFPYGIKGTIIALIGFCFFSFSYSTSIVIGNRTYFCEEPKYVYEYNKEKITRFALIGWVFCFACSMQYFMAAGKGVGYILSLGFLSDTTEGSIGGSASIGFTSMFTYSLIPLYLIYNRFCKNKKVSYALFYGTIAVQFIRGFRFIVVVLVLSVFIGHYLTKEKRPLLKDIIGLVLLLLIAIGVVGFCRSSTRSGSMSTLDWGEFGVDTIVDAILGNLRIYKTYYAVIKAVPESVSYMFGQQMFVYTAIMFIPRMIWPSKPGNPGMEAVISGISEYAANAGQAYPNIGEFYYEFGVVGVMVFMFLFGWMLRKIKVRYLYSKDPLDIIVISIWISSTLQIVIRGYTPSNFYLLLFMLMPIKLLRLLCVSEIKLKTKYEQIN